MKLGDGDGLYSAVMWNCNNSEQILNQEVSHKTPSFKIQASGNNKMELRAERPLLSRGHTATS